MVAGNHNDRESDLDDRPIQQGQGETNRELRRRLVYLENKARQTDEAVYGNGDSSLAKNSIQNRLVDQAGEIEDLKNKFTDFDRVVAKMFWIICAAIVGGVVTMVGVVAKAILPLLSGSGK